MNHREERAGFIKLVVYLIIIIVIASVIFKLDFEKISKNEQLKKNVDFVKVKAELVWKEHLSQPFLHFWNNLALNFVKEAIKSQGNPFEGMTAPQFEEEQETSTEGQVTEEKQQKALEAGATLN